MKYLILGASKGLGLCLSESLAKIGHNLVILSRNLRDLEKIKSSLELKYKISVDIYNLDLSNDIEEINKFFQNNHSNLKNIDGIFLTAATMDINDIVIDNASIVRDLINSNLKSQIIFIYKFYEIFKVKKQGLIVGFGSVAEMLGRSQNILYSASKKFLKSFFESLIISTSNNNISIHFYILGYLNTTLSSSKKLFLPRGNVQKLSKKIIENINKKNIYTYFPSWWIVISYLFINTPFFIKRIIFNFFKNEKY